MGIVATNQVKVSFSRDLTEDTLKQYFSSIGEVTNVYCQNNGEDLLYLACGEAFRSDLFSLRCCRNYDARKIKAVFHKVVIHPSL